MALRQKLVVDIKTYFKQCKWSDILNDQIIQILQVQPSSPFSYLQKKISLRSKLDNSKHGTFLGQLLIYCHAANPLTAKRQDIENKILYLTVDKYQHTKLRRNQIINIMNALFLLSGAQDKQKQYFMKLVGQNLQPEAVPALTFARNAYATMLYISMKNEVDELDEKLSQAGHHINAQIFKQYLENVNQNVSIIKKHFGKNEIEGDIYRTLAQITLRQIQEQ